MDQFELKTAETLAYFNLAELTKEEADRIYDQGREAVVFALLRMVKERAEVEQRLKQ